MKHLIAALCLACPAPTAQAQDIQFIGPGATVVEMNIDTCPQGMMCVDAPKTDHDTNLSLMLPEWIEETTVEARKTDINSAAYVRGLSDSSIVDFCDDCQCCAVALDGGDGGGLSPWQGAAHALQMKPSLDGSD